MGRHRIATTVVAAVVLTVGAWSFSAVTDRETDAGASPAATNPAPPPAVSSKPFPSPGDVTAAPGRPAAATGTNLGATGRFDDPGTRAAADRPVAADGPTPATPSAGASVVAFLLDLNRLRVAEGVEPLVLDPGLSTAAAGWARAIAAEGELRHSELIYDLVAGRWTTAGENVGFGPDEAAVFDGFEASPAHRANMVDPDYTHVGIAVVPVERAFFTVHLFAG